MKRWPIVRHVRYWWLSRRLGRFFTRYDRHSYLLVSVDDMLFLDRVWRGEA